MGRTIGELFRDPNSYRYGTNYSEVKSDTETINRTRNYCH